MVATIEKITTAESWVRANRKYLQDELRRLRLLLRRRVLWMRRIWERDPLSNSRGIVISDALADRLVRGFDAEEEAAFYCDDAECLAIAEALNEVEAQLETQRAGLTDEGRVPSLEGLCRTFHLSPFERDVLLLSFAVRTDPDFAILSGYLHDDANACYLTESQAANILCADPKEREAARSAFLPLEPLRRFRLILLDRGAARTGQPSIISIDERVADYIRGVNHLDERLAYLLRIITPVFAAGGHQELVDSLLSWAQTFTGQAWPMIHFTGALDSGKELVAAEFCARLGAQLYQLDVRQLPLHEEDRHQLLHLIERESMLSHFALYVNLDDIEMGDKVQAAAAKEWVERSGGILFVGARERVEFHRPVFHFAIAKPGAVAQRAIWNALLADVPNSVNGQIESIVEQFNLGPRAIPQAIANGVARAQRRSAESNLAPEDLWHACREQVGWRLGGLAQRLDLYYGWDDIVLPDDTADQLREIASQVPARAQVYEHWGFGARLPRGRGISALFSGPSGTGKTMAAEIIARHLELDLYRIDLAGVVSKYIGETEKNLRSVFDAAEESGAILFFDEADALFGRRSEVKDSHDRYANIEIDYLLQRMEEYRGLAILCTNRRSSLDRAFLRRLRFLVEFPFPDGEQRRTIWQKVFPVEAPLEALDLDALARLEISGGNIRNVALNAAFLAAQQQTNIQMKHVLHAARREYVKIDKLLTEAEFGAHYGQMKA